MFGIDTGKIKEAFATYLKEAADIEATDSGNISKRLTALETLVSSLADGFGASN